MGIKGFMKGWIKEWIKGFMKEWIKNNFYSKCSYHWMKEIKKIIFELFWSKYIIKGNNVQKAGQNNLVFSDIGIDR